MIYLKSQSDWTREQTLSIGKTFYMMLICKKFIPQMLDDESYSWLSGVIRSICFLWVLCGCVDISSGWTSEILISSGSGNHTESKNTCFMSVSSDLMKPQKSIDKRSYLFQVSLVWPMFVSKTPSVSTCPAPPPLTSLPPPLRPLTLAQPANRRALLYQRPWSSLWWWFPVRSDWSVWLLSSWTNVRYTTTTQQQHTVFTCTQSLFCYLSE